MGLRAVRRERDKVFVLEDAGGLIALLNECHAQIMMRNDIIRLDLQGVIERRYCAIGIAFRDERQPQIVISLHKIGLQFYHRPESFNRFVQVFVLL